MNERESLERSGRERKGGGERRTSDVLKENQWNSTLRAKFNEVCAFEGRFTAICESE